MVLPEKYPISLVLDGDTPRAIVNSSWNVNNVNIMLIMLIKTDLLFILQVLYQRYSSFSQNICVAC